MRWTWLTQTTPAKVYRAEAPGLYAEFEELISTQLGWPYRLTYDDRKVIDFHIGKMLTSPNVMNHRYGLQYLRNKKKGVIASRVNYARMKRSRVS